MLLSETIAILAIVVALHAHVQRSGTRRRTRNVVAVGLACAVAALARTELLALFPVVAGSSRCS